MSHARAFILAAEDGGVALGGLGGGLVVWVAVLAGLAMMPFVLTMVTSFAKLVIVGGIVRQALGTQQVPPNTVITGLALILSIHVMWPVGVRIQTAFERLPAASAPLDEAGKPLTGAAREAAERVRTLSRAAEAAHEPIRAFLLGNSDPRSVEMFRRLAAHAEQRGGGAGASSGEGAGTGLGAAMGRWKEELTVLTPAFVLTELTEAFKIGFLIFVPFLVIDLVVSNILLALGMHMLSPQTVSLPLKLMLFVLVDGWRLIIKGLVLSYH